MFLVCRDSDCADSEWVYLEDRYDTCEYYKEHGLLLGMGDV